MISDVPVLLTYIPFLFLFPLSWLFGLEASGSKISKSEGQPSRSRHLNNMFSSGVIVVLGPYPTGTVLPSIRKFRKFELIVPRYWIILSDWLVKL
ncbi:hypothetical protein IW261DRAFT_617073 [Armillaria novae-zelandiae]|uniref:Uncharacterized protein n=1 Tax=Armillaria novae-zelandiae TaxID=153914 RepID=A0AA39PP81_9AGAR|nr:hypothetical protein IW261DRAFT_617073 [Armillaria novae-zelandiae]